MVGEHLERPISSSEEQLINNFDIYIWISLLAINKSDLSIVLLFLSPVQR